MPTMFIAISGSDNPIRKVEVERATDCFVFVRAGAAQSLRRRARVSAFESYHETWAEARAALVREAKASLDSAKLHYDRARVKLSGLEALREPA